MDDDVIVGGQHGELVVVDGLVAARHLLGLEVNQRVVVVERRPEDQLATPRTTN